MINQQAPNLGNVQGIVERPDLPGGEGVVVICGKAEQYKVTGTGGVDAGVTLKIEVKPVDFGAPAILHRIRITKFGVMDNSDVQKQSGTRALRNLRALLIALLGAGENPLFTTMRADPNVCTPADEAREKQALEILNQAYQALLAGQFDGHRLGVKCQQKKSNFGTYYTHKFYTPAA